uniref:Uncharacterized protein ycf20 n=1 Tax=Rhodymenia pseudopalmata TaxID=31502 RepID=A0A1C9C7K1_RHOPU|nr:hypothetical protein Rhodyp_075 [Rhodymenia pseudopalmata]AOM64353.1 hypothetical protein Rhodyp_075 [Rhodymenia pseudopalmata]
MLIKEIFHSKYNTKLDTLSLRLISLYLGFFISTILSTITAQTGDWNIIASSIIVTANEVLSRFIYNRNNSKSWIINAINSVKIGIIYGLFVDAFKLGS